MEKNPLELLIQSLLSTASDRQSLVKEGMILALIHALGGSINQPIAINGKHTDNAVAEMKAAMKTPEDNHFGVVTKAAEDGVVHFLFCDVSKEEAKAWFADKENKETFPNIKPSIVL